MFLDKIPYNLLLKSNPWEQDKHILSQPWRTFLLIQLPETIEQIEHIQERNIDILVCHHDWIRDKQPEIERIARDQKKILIEIQENKEEIHRHIGQVVQNIEEKIKQQTQNQETIHENVNSISEDLEILTGENGRIFAIETNSKQFQEYVEEELKKIWKHITDIHIDKGQIKSVTAENTEKINHITTQHKADKQYFDDKLDKVLKKMETIGDKLKKQIDEQGEKINSMIDDVNRCIKQTNTIENLQSTIYTITQEKAKERMLLGVNLTAFEKYKKDNPGKKFAWLCDMFPNKYRKILSELGVAPQPYEGMRYEDVIIALRDIPKWNVRAGDIGGFVNRDNSSGGYCYLNPNDDSWIWGGSNCKPKKYSSTDYGGLHITNDSCYYYPTLNPIYGDDCSSNWYDEYHFLNDGACHGSANIRINNGSTCSIGSRSWNNNKSWMNIRYEDR